HGYAPCAGTPHRKPRQLGEQWLVTCHHQSLTWPHLPPACRQRQSTIRTGQIEVAMYPPVLLSQALSTREGGPCHGVVQVGTHHFQKVWDTGGWRVASLEEKHNRIALCHLLRCRDQSSNLIGLRRQHCQHGSGWTGEPPAREEDGRMVRVVHQGQ